LSGRILSAIEKGSNDTMTYVGIEINMVLKWFEYLFNEKMSWENQGTYWHIDNVIPVNSFDLTQKEQQFKCFNWKNLRPCEGTEKLKKNDTIEMETIDHHFTQLRTFFEQNAGNENLQKENIEQYLDQIYQHLNESDSESEGETP
jgi:hypothetical protein